MKIKLMIVSLLLWRAPFVLACGISPDLYASWVLSTNEPTAAQAVVVLRGLGERGIEAMFRTHAEMIAKHDEANPQWKRLRAAIDAIGAQRDCYASRLFWHTNFDQAQAEARRTGKPILSLRLLGNLDEELSCANSRFFRTTLYANQQVSDYLRKHFVLHWKSVRPVPRITINFGDGRLMERTITGNSIHYVLDSNGEVVDALPGLYGARAFLTALGNAEPMAVQSVKLDDRRRKVLLESYHLGRLREINRQWSADLAQVGLPVGPPKKVAAAVPVNQPPNAAAAMPLAVGKAMVEQPMLRVLAPRRDALEHSTDEPAWAKIGALHPSGVALDVNVLSLMRAKQSMGPNSTEASYGSMIRTLKEAIAEDTVRNEYLFHAKIHEWFATPNAAIQLDTLNSRVYAELFLTPESDPWLGLAPQQVFSALENGGLKMRNQMQSPAQDRN